jgi:hypothetical protein
MNPVKIVVRFTDGQIRKGYYQNFLRDRPVFQLTKNRTGGLKDAEEVHIAKLKAVSFVDTFAENQDQEEHKNFALGDHPRGEGWRLHMWVVRSF